MANRVFTFFLAALCALAAHPLLAQAAAPPCAKTTKADVVALDQAFYNNRLGAFQAGGMIFALRRDVRSIDSANPALRAGRVMLRSDKRPRPIVLRVNRGDCLEVSFQNLLNGDAASPSDSGVNGPVISDPANFPVKTNLVPGNTSSNPYKPNENVLKPAYNAQGTGAQTGWTTPNPSVSQPATRYAGVHVEGLNVVSARDANGPIAAISGDGTWVGANDVFAANDARRRSGLVAPGERITYTLYAGVEGAFLLYSTAATVGQSGAFGGQLSQGLFGSVSVQPAGTEWYRSQVTRQDLLDATHRATAQNVTRGTGTATFRGQTFPLWRSTVTQGDVILMNADGAPAETGGYLHTPAGQPIINYGAMRNGVPILRMTDDGGNLVYTDLTAIIAGPGGTELPEPSEGPDRNQQVYPNARQPFREFAIHYHDDFVTTQAFPEFNGTLQYTLGAGRDFFAINYGMGGIGAEILSNRFGVGPMHNCTTCRFEEFFLSSWTNGDPAQVVDVPANSQICSDPAHPDDCTLQLGPKATKAFFPDDPSNVYHSYLSDHVKFQILHAGTNITHVHHLHAQQWLHSPKNNDGHYRDSQLISPGAAYTLDHVFNGSGNLNKTIGDSIFHCHFYPHFAQGMWSFWRVHDTFEEGTRMNADQSVQTGWNRALPDGEIAAGTPTPGLVPLPTIPMAPIPARVQLVPVRAMENGNPLNVGYAVQVHPDDTALSPGYPFFIPGVAGQRAPHPPMDFAWEEDAQGKPARDADGKIRYLDGGLPRSIALFDPRPYQQETRWDFTKINDTITAVELPQEGTEVEKVAMAMHAVRNHPSYTPEGKAAPFVTNGRPPVPGAPYADPAVNAEGDSTCNDTVPASVLDPGANQPCLVRYKAADIQIDAVVNKKGWHFPQTRLLTLWGDVNATIDNKRMPQPFFFRANSRQAIEFWHANLVPNYYELDDFQVRTPTDIIGQHIHLVKFDVTSSDGGGNGYNYEDGTFSPQEVREIISSINKRRGLFQSMTLTADGFTVGGSQRLLRAKSIPYFGDGPDKAWLGAQTTIQRWYADPVLGTQDKTGYSGSVAEHSDRPDVGQRDQTLRTVFTHDHFGPSTHQQAGLYAGLLVEPTNSQWFDPETNALLGSNQNRPVGKDGKPAMDGGPTNWQALIVNTVDQKNSYREFALEFQDRQLAYDATSRTTPSPYIPGNTANYTGWADPTHAISPPLSGGGPAPFPFIVTGSFGTGTYSMNYRNEPLPFRVAPFRSTFQTNPPVDPNAADLSHVFRSIVRADGALNVQPKAGTPVAPNSPFQFPQPYTGASGTDPYTPLMRAYAGDNVQVRTLVGAHMSPHTFTMHGVNWLFETENDQSGYRATQSMGISEHFEMLFNVPRSASPTGAADYFYSSSSDVNGLQSGNWGIMRAYNTPQQNLIPLPNNNPPNDGAVADCTGWANTPQKTFNVSAVNVASLSNAAKQKLRLFYNRRGRGGSSSEQLFDPSALVYLLDGKVPEDSNFEPLILRANAGDCITLKLTNSFSGGVGSTTLARPWYNVAFQVNAGTVDAANQIIDAFNLLNNYNSNFMTLFNGNRYGFALPPPTARVVTVTPQSGGKSWQLAQSQPTQGSFLVTQTSATVFSVAATVPMQTSAQAGLHAQLVAFDPATSNGINVGQNPVQTATAGNSETYVWYAGRVSSDGTPQPVEFGSVNLTPSDPLRQHPFGLIGALIIEPQNSTWRADDNSMASATVTKQDGTKFREFVAVVQDDVSGLTMNGTVDRGTTYVLGANTGTPNPSDTKAKPVLNWATGTPFDAFTFAVPSGSKYIVTAGDSVSARFQKGTDKDPGNGFTFLDKTKALAMFDIAQPSSTFSAQGSGNTWGTNPTQCPSQTMATLVAKPGVAQRSTVDFVGTTQVGTAAAARTMTGTFVYADINPDIQIMGMQIGGTAPGEGTHVWGINSVPQPNGTRYSIKPGQKILVSVASELHGITFLPTGGNTDPAATEAMVRQVFDIDPLISQPTFAMNKFVPYIGVPAIPGGWGTAGYGAPMKLMLLTVRNDIPANITEVPFECTIHQADMLGTFVINQPGTETPGNEITISGDVVNGANTWTFTSPAIAPGAQPMPNGSTYRVQPGDIITFNVKNGTHGVTFLTDQKTAERIFEFLPGGQPFQVQPENVAPAPPPSWGTKRVTVNPPGAPVVLARVRVRGDVPFSLQAVPFECSVHTTNMAGVIAIGNADASSVGVTTAPSNWNKAVNYRTEPLPYRYANSNFMDDFDPCGNLSPLGISRALSNTLVQADPATPVFVAEAGSPVRMRLLHPGGNDEQTFLLNGHSWQEEPYNAGSTEIANNPTSQWLGGRDGFGPNVSWDLVTESAGGAARVTGDYLYRTFIGTDFVFGMWGVMRVGEPGKDVITVTQFPRPGQQNVPANGAMIAGVASVNPSTGTLADFIRIRSGSIDQRVAVERGTGRWSYANPALAVPVELTSIKCNDANCSSPTTWATLTAPAYIPVIQQNIAAPALDPNAIDLGEVARYKSLGPLDSTNPQPVAPGPTPAAPGQPHTDGGGSNHH
ncbi:MAG TPA: hypothetical protein VGF69_14170 [Thermoanaerobaculia bacterium]|jgi:hypothetical protein